MKTEFVLRIDIASDHTRGDANLADILSEIARDIEFRGILDNRTFQARDLKGNVVGRYGRYTQEDEK